MLAGGNAMRAASLAVLLAAAAAPVMAQAPMRFWNTSTRIFTGVFLAPAGTGQYGPNQALNDSDRSVSADERLKLTGVAPGRYDVRLVDGAGRSCVVPGVDVVGNKPYAFSIGEDQLRHCAE